MTDKPEKSSATAKAGLVLSILALLVSGVSFWYSNLRGPVINVRVGYEAALSVSNDDQLELLMSVVYTNTGARPGSASALEVLCLTEQKTSLPKLYPVYFAKLDSAGNAQITSMTGPEVIKGGDQFTRHILFLSRVREMRDHTVPIGKYSCTVSGMVDGTKLDIDKFGLTVTDEDAAAIEKCPAANRYIYTDQANAPADVLHFNVSDCPEKSAP